MSSYCVKKIFLKSRVFSLFLQIKGTREQRMGGASERMAGYRGRQGQGHSGARPVSLALSTKGIHRGPLYVCSHCVPSLGFKLLLTER